MSVQVTRNQLAKIIGDKSLKTEDKSLLAKQIAAYFSEQHKSIDIESLMRDIMQYRLEKGIIEAVIVSAHEVSDQVKFDVKDLLKQHFPDAKKVLVSSRIDENLVGGVRIDLPQESIDLSIRSKLNLFKRLVAERN